MTRIRCGLPYIYLPVMGCLVGRMEDFSSMMITRRLTMSNHEVRMEKANGYEWIRTLVDIIISLVVMIDN